MTVAGGVGFSCLEGAFDVLVAFTAGRVAFSLTGAFDFAGVLLSVGAFVDEVTVRSVVLLSLLAVSEGTEVSGLVASALDGLVGSVEALLDGFFGREGLVL